MVISRLPSFNLLTSHSNQNLAIMAVGARFGWLLALAALAAGQTYDTRFDGVTWDHANWRLTTTELDQGHYQSRMSVANGYIGINVAALGPFFEVDEPVNGDMVNGWPLFQRRQTFATVGGFWDSQPTTNESNYPWLYQYGWDSAISGIPHWGGIVVDLGDSNYLDASTDASTISDFSSTLDMKNGLMNWAFTWSPNPRTSFNVTYQMFAHKVSVNQAFVVLNITAADDTNATIANVLNGDCAVRTTPGQNGVDGGLVYTSVSPNGVHNVSAFVFADMTVNGTQVTSRGQFFLDRPYVGNNRSSIASGVSVRLRAGRTATITKYVGIASSDAYQRPRVVARNAALIARRTGYQQSLAAHAAEWARLLPPDSVDDFADPENGTLPDDRYIIEDSILAVVNPYYILQNTISQNTTSGAPEMAINSHSISVGGLGSDSYAGQVFWDAETWMQPGLVATHPYAAKGISNYRVARFPQAQANIQTAYQSSKNDTNFSDAGAIYSWTSGRYGNCTATGPCWDYEYHINGDIAQAFTNYWLTSGDTDFFRDELFPVHDAIAIMFSEVLQKNGSRWSLTNATDPDEFASHVNNVAFTQALIANTLDNTNYFRGLFNQTANKTWSSQADNVLIGRDQDANILLEYTGMNGTIEVKQADVVLVTYPLSYTGNDYDATGSLADLDYYAAKQSPDGPAMTYSIFSIVANQVSPSGCSAYTYHQYSSHPYVRAPWFQLSEQLVDGYDVTGYHPAYPFLTGHGGANQVVLFGYLGLRLIPTSSSLHISPALPPQIPYIRYRTFHFHGWPISSFSNQTHTTLSRNSSITPAEGAFPNSTFADTPITVAVGDPGSSDIETFSLSQDSSITVSNRMYAFRRTVPDNVAQCQSVTSPDSYKPGQFPIAAVDGAASTKWQPELANRTASITVEVPVGYKVLSMGFDWAQAPPYNYSVRFHNRTDGQGVEVASGNVSISAPYNPQRIATIVPVGANKTSVDITGAQEGGDVFTSRYATLSIWGSWFNSSITRRNMSGDGASVAEWSIVVEDPPSGIPGGSAGPVKVKREGDGMWGSEREMLGLMGRYNREWAKRREGMMQWV